MDLSWVFAAARRRWRLLFLLFLLGPTAAAVNLVITPVQYRSTATVIFAVEGATTVRELVDGGTYVQQVVPSYAQLAESPTVLQDVVTSLGLSIRPGALAQQITVETRSDELLASISADDDTADGAAALANEVAKQLGVAVDRLSRGTGGTTRPVSLTTVSRAEPAAAPFAPDYLRGALLGLLGGTLLAAVYLYLRESVSATLRTRSDIAELTESPVLGAVVRDPRAKRRPLPLDSHPHIPRSESFWMLRNGLLPRLGSETVVLAIVSARRGEGRTSVSANLGIAIAHAGHRVLLIDGDLRGRRLGRFFGVADGPGVAAVLSGADSFERTVRHWAPRSLRGRGLDVLPAEETLDDATVLMASSRLTQLLDNASRNYDLVIVDTPALLDGTSGTLIAAQSDAAVVVVNSGTSGGRDLTEVLHRLGPIAPLLGIVLNNASQTWRAGGRRPTGDIDRPAEGVQPLPGQATGPMTGWWSRVTPPDSVERYDRDSSPNAPMPPPAGPAQQPSRPTGPPVSQPPVSQPPVSQPPVSQPPVSQPPMSQPPTSSSAAPPPPPPPHLAPPVAQPPRQPAPPVRSAHETSSAAGRSTPNPALDGVQPATELIDMPAGAPSALDRAAGLRPSTRAAVPPPPVTNPAQSGAADPGTASPVWPRSSVPAPTAAAGASSTSSNGRAPVDQERAGDANGAEGDPTQRHPLAQVPSWCAGLQAGEPPATLPSIELSAIRRRVLELRSSTRTSEDDLEGSEHRPGDERP